MAVYTIESLPRLKTVQLSALTNCHELELHPDCLTVRGKSREEKASIKLKLDLSSSQIIHISLRDSILTLKLRSHDKEGSSSEPILPPRDSLTDSTYEPTSLHHIACGFCASILTKEPSSFKRVLPLPSESWEEFSGGVFCHYREPKADDEDDGDGSLMSVPSTVKLHPRGGDCFFSTSSLLLCSSSLNWDHVTKDTTKKTICCNRCSQFLGSSVTGSSPEAWSLKRSSISTTFQCNNGVHSSSRMSRLEAYFANELYSFGQSQMAFRYFVKDPTGYRHLYIWMLNVCSELVSNSLHSAHYGHFTGDVSTEMQRSGRVLKILFKYQPPHATEEKNAMELPVDECMLLKLLLVDSNMSLPLSQREASGYNVGYLQYQQT